MKQLFAAVIVGIFFSLFASQCSLDTRATDLLYGETPADQNVVIVAIDEASIDALGLYPWSRAVHAELIDALIVHTPNVIAFDIGFFEELPETYVLAGAIARANEAGVPVVFTEELQYNPFVLRVPHESFIVKTGYSNLLLDSDGVLREVPLREQGRLPFAAVVAKTQGPMFLPQEENTRIHYVGPPGSFERIPYIDALKGNTFFENKTVFVGVTAAALHDDYVTPVSAGKSMPGVEIHANIYQMIRQQNFARDAPAWPFLLGFAVLGGLLIWATFSFFGKPWFALGGLLTIPLYILITVVSFNNGLLLKPVTPILAFLSGAGASSGVWIHAQQREKRYLRGAFEKYVSPDVIKNILRNPQTLGLGGVSRELTILFSDIRGFTSLSEKLTPEELVTLLNDYLTAMTNVIQEHTGTVDKYIGDAIMAFWNAPLHQKDHAVLGCKTALSMMQTLRKLQREKRFANLHVGIGLNTGEVVVGNMGSHQRFDYTCMGDAVNLSSRLEGLTKQYKVDILVSEMTKKVAGDAFAYRKIDRVRVKGKKNPIRIYELLEKKSPGHDLFEEALMDYFEGRWLVARKKFTKVNDAQSKLFLERMALMKKPPKNWDGVWTHESK